MSAAQISLIEMYTGQRGKVRELLDDMREMNRRLEEIVANPELLLGMSWAGPPWDELADEYGYKHDGDPV